MLIGLSQATLAQTGRYFSEYHKVSQDEERAQLDNFAFHLTTHDKTSIGYMLYYIESDETAKVKARQKRAERAKRYLMKEFGIPKSRIVLISCGKFVEETTILQPMSPSDPAPKCGNN